MLKYIVMVGAAAMLQGCLVFIPGSVVGAATDSITGNTGQNCVAGYIRVGDKIRLTDGRVAVVEKLEGTTSRCSDPSFPVRALLKFTPPTPTPPSTPPVARGEPRVIADSEVALGDKLSDDEYCAVDRLRVGDRIRLRDGKAATVTIALGASSRCLQPSYPALIRVSTD
jgi:hypothetical protein